MDSLVKNLLDFWKEFSVLTFSIVWVWDIQGIHLPLIFQYCNWQHFDSEEGVWVQGQKDWLVLFIITNYSVTNEFEIRLKILYEKSIVLIRAFQVIYTPPFVGLSGKSQIKPLWQRGLKAVAIPIWNIFWYLKWIV